MGKVVRCPECAKVYRGPEELEELRDNDSVCMVCNAPIEVSDWDRVLASWEEDEDEPAEVDDDDDLDEDDDWSDDEDEFGDDAEDDLDDDFEPDFDDDEDDEDSLEHA